MLFMTLGGAYRLWLCCKPHLKTCFTASLTSWIYRSALWNTIAAINLGMYGPPTQRRAADHNKTFTAAQSWGMYGAGGGGGGGGRVTEVTLPLIQRRTPGIHADL